MGYKVRVRNWPFGKNQKKNPISPLPTSSMSNTFASHSRQLTNVLSSIRGILARPKGERDSGAIDKAKSLVAGEN